ncbi:GGDEF domain-containing protein [Sulfuritalea sp.]|uniref:GGDEF domain-containing protein n=1 Tax=Sulfuritalea sp. TaxID=2480090 RepID=UPI00286E0AC4|nr:GGDEF domain-containing protein [Sulfuritalea sp.]
MNTKSFKTKWALGILVLVATFIASQSIYRSSITRLHDHLVAAARITEQMHASEKFHSAMHLMLIAAAAYAGTGNDTFRTEFVRQQEVARAFLATLAAQPHGKSTHTPDTDDLEANFTAYSQALDGVVATGNRGDGRALARSRELFDTVFVHYYAGLHQRHEADLNLAQASAHRIQFWTSTLFYAQLGLAVLISVFGLFYLERIARSFLAVAERLAVTDGLTGVFNRRYLDTTLDEELSRAGRHGRPLTIAMIDIDHFKRFNDAHGHQAGDRLLRDLTKLMRQNVRAEDRIARYGGEEFVVILPETPLGDGVLAAEKLRQVTADRFPVGDGRTFPVTISIGLAAFPGDGTTGTELIRQADERLYCAKAEGRNRVVPSVAPAMDTASTAPAAS